MGAIFNHSTSSFFFKVDDRVLLREVQCPPTKGLVLTVPLHSAFFNRALQELSYSKQPSAQFKGRAYRGSNVPVNSKTAHAQPGQTPGHFLKNFGQIPLYIASLDGQMPHPLEL